MPLAVFFWSAPSPAQVARLKSGGVGFWMQIGSIDEASAGAALGADRGEGARIGRHDAWQEQRELAGVPAVERQRRQRRPGNHLADRRRLRLQHGRFADHAFELGQILRRFLEATTATRPGLTTPELVAHVRESGLADADLGRFRGLLEGWDRVKFARAPLTVEDAVRTENAVERVKALTGGGAHWAFEAYGSGATTRMAVDMVRKRGTAVIVGIAPVGDDAVIEPVVITRMEKTIRGCYYGTARPRQDMPRIADWYGRGLLDIDGLVSTTIYKLDAATGAPMIPGCFVLMHGLRDRARSEKRPYADPS